MDNFNEQVIAEAIDYLAAHWQTQPDLDVLAGRAGYAPTYFQKLFKDKTGISPKRMLQYMNMRHARDLLLQGCPALDAAYLTGLSGSGRLHDLFVAVEAATPGEVMRKGRGLQIVYGWHPTPLGEILIGQTGRGVCWLGFVVDGARTMAFDRMRAYWPAAAFVEDRVATAAAAAEIMKIWRGHGVPGQKLKLDLYGTNFQLQVWRALLKIPTGATVSYRQIATHIGKPAACRAVGSAVGANPVSLLIPCHRVIQSTGIVENYGWGSPRKKLLLGLEGNIGQGDGGAVL